MGPGDRLPEFIDIETRTNGAPLTVEQLCGRVVAVQFWTFACINCRNTLPHVKQLYRDYEAKGLVVVGVHTPELPEERVVENVGKAVKDEDIVYPVAVDEAYQTWRAYGNEYWPHIYLADRTGRIRYDHIGEGDYEVIDRSARALVNERRSS